MAGDKSLGRRLFLRNVGLMGGTGLFGAAVSRVSDAASPPEPKDLDPQSLIFKNWATPLHEIATVKDLGRLNGLDRNAVKERHRIYSLLLMKLIFRFWNGNKLGPVGTYPQRDGQIEVRSATGNVHRYFGDMNAPTDDRRRIRWDRYLGHNIACLAVDGSGEIIDFEFNHNEIFRSSAEHAETRLVRRIFSLADIFDHWNTGRTVPDKSRAASLSNVTLYTSLESCAQCSGVMSLGRIRQVVFMQHDPGAYRIGNIMYNLADPDPGSTIRTAAMPIPADMIGMGSHLQALDGGYKTFQSKIGGGDAFFIFPGTGARDTAPSITSFLCTDDALAAFRKGMDEFDTLTLAHSRDRDTGLPVATGDSQPWTNGECLLHAKKFYQYASVEGFRGSPHK